MSGIWNNVRYAMRGLRRSPGFAVTVAVTLALGIAANAVAFSLLDSLVLRPLRLPGAERLEFFNSVNEHGRAWPSFSFPDYRDLRDRNRSFEGVAAYRVLGVGVGYAGSVEKRWALLATGNYFDVLGVKPAVGRFFHASDEHGAGNSPYAVLDYTYWKRHFGGDVSVVGRVIELNKHPYTVLGVAPESFAGTELFMHPDLWVPALQQKQMEGWDALENRSSGMFWLIGRLRPGVTASAAESDANRVATGLGREHKEDEGLTMRLGRPGFVGEMLGSPVRAFVWGLLGLAGLLLVAACANLGSLFAARASDRARELAVRMALGARRSTVAGQLVAEALLLSMVGGAMGLVLAELLVRGIDMWRPSLEFPAQLSVSVDWPALVVAGLLSAACGVFFGLLPLPQIARADAYAVIKNGPSLDSGRRRWTLRDALLLLQVVACSVLVTGSLVALRGLERTLHTSFGFQPDGVTLARVDFKMAGYDDKSALPVERAALDRMAVLPGVTAVGFGSSTPLSLDISTTAVYRDGTRDERPANVLAAPNFFEVSPGYLAATGIRLLAGRDVSWGDDDAAPQVMVVNQNLVRRVWGPGVTPAEAVGRYLMHNSKRTEVVGVVQDGKYESITEDPLAAVFLPVGQSHESDVALIARGGDPAAVRQVLRDLDPGVPALVTGWKQELGLAMFPAVAASLALGVLGGLAALLAMTGIFGMASYAVSRRLREFGIRMALGAPRKEVLRAALGRPAMLFGVGSVAGLLLGAAASRVLGQVVYGASSRDPLVLGGVVVAMAGLALVATWVPAQRAMGVDPARLLREE